MRENEQRSSLFRKKPIASEGDNSSALKRALGPLDLTTLGVGAIIGTGIFVLTGVAAATYAGLALYCHFCWQVSYVHSRHCVTRNLPQAYRHRVVRTRIVIRLLVK